MVAASLSDATATSVVPIKVNSVPVRDDEDDALYRGLQQIRVRFVVCWNDDMAAPDKSNSGVESDFQSVVEDLMTHGPVALTTPRASTIDLRPFSASQRDAPDTATRSPLTTRVCIAHLGAPFPAERR